MTLGARKLRWVQNLLLGGPVLATWQLSRCGGAACLQCEQELSAGEEWATAETCARVSAQLSSWGTLMVALVGGNDPFLHPHLVDVVKQVSGGHLTGLSSSGWGVSTGRARAVWEAGLVEATVTLFGADAATHDSAVGVPGAHARALRAVETLRETRCGAHQRVSLGYTLGATGAAGLEAVLDLAERRGIGVIVEPPCDGVRVPDGISGALAEIKRRRGEVLRSSLGYLTKMDEALAKGIRGCKAGRRSVHIDYRGRVSRCGPLSGRSEPLGDLCTEDGAAVLPRLRKASGDNGCTECWRSVRGEIECLGSWRGLWALSSWLWA